MPLQLTGGMDGATMAGGSGAMTGAYGATAASCTFRRGSKLKSRLPVHMYVTVAAAHRSKAMGQQWNQVGVSHPPRQRCAHIFVCTRTRTHAHTRTRTHTHTQSGTSGLPTLGRCC